MKGDKRSKSEGPKGSRLGTSNNQHRTSNIQWMRLMSLIALKVLKITIGFWPGVMVYAASAFFGSGWGRVNGSTIFNDFRYYVTASKSARGCHVGRQTECAQAF